LNSWKALAGLFTLFMVPRLLMLGDARWTGEESSFFSQIYATGQGLRWSALGTPVSGTHGSHPGPYFYWLLAPFSLGASPWLVSFAVALFDSLGHLLALAGLKRLWGEGEKQRLALGVATGLLALSPWALLYADRPWNSNLVSLPVGLALFGLASWWRKGGLGGFLCLTAGLAVLPSFHLSAPILGLPMLLAVASRWRLLNRRSVLAGAMLSTLIWAPYLSHEWENSAANTRALLSRSLPSVSSPSNTLLALSWPLRLVAPEIGYHAQKGYWSPYQPGAWTRPDSSAGSAWHRVHTSLALPGILLGLGLAFTSLGWWLFGLRRRKNRDLFAFILAVGTLSGWMLLLIAGRRAYPHYLHPLLPFYAGAFGLGLAELCRPGRWRALLLGAFVVQLFSGVVVSARFQSENDQQFGLNANLYTLELIRRFGDVKPYFCGALGYRSSNQLKGIAEVSHAGLRLDGKAFSLVHALPGNLPDHLIKMASWRQKMHGVEHFLIEGALPESWRRVGCR
jgi:hypothetical protein